MAEPGIADPLISQAHQETPVQTDAPIGERILGTVNPRTLTREQFDQSPDLLFHGSSRPFTFSRNFDYHNLDYLEIDEGSSVTLGFGFYATDREDATDYSEVRARLSLKEAAPHVTSILPYQAKVLDLRSQSDPTRNAPLSQEFVGNWITHYKDFVTNPNRYNSVNPNVAPHLERMGQDYLKFLDRIASQPVDELKRLLRTNQYPGPYWMYTFRDFMLSRGYDGLICNEASEKDRSKFVTAYVFYNLDKIGTYETWHKQPEVQK